jgi:hypothetical protein
VEGDIVTEEDIKRGVEVRLEALEVRLMTEELTRECYENCLKRIDAWAEEQRAK